jgi:molecular chaperone GrpE
MQDSNATPTPEALPDASTAENAVPPAPTLDQPAAEVMPSLEDLLKTAELKAAEHHDAWLRAKAETENVRRRAQEDIAKAGKYAVEKFSGELLAVKDSLEAALANENQSAENLKAGVELTLRQLVAAFRKIESGRDQPGRPEVRPAPAPGDQPDRSRRRTEHRHQRAAEGLCPARPRDPPGAGGGVQGQGLKHSANNPISDTA